MKPYALRSLASLFVPVLSVAGRRSLPGPVRANLPQNGFTEGLVLPLRMSVTIQAADAARSGGLGRPGAELSSIRVTVAESPNARAWYEAPLR